MPDHTPGPWVFDENTCDIIAANGRIVSDSEWDSNDPEQVANIRLILAAPDLFAACQHIHDWITMNLQEPIEVGSEIELQLRRALAKAVPNL